MAEQLSLSININGTEQVVTSIGEIKKALKDAEFQALALEEKFGASSPQVIALRKNIEQLRDKIGDAKDATNSFAEGGLFKTAGKALAGLASGFAAVQGAVALLGGEGKDLEKTLLKVQSAIALSQSLSQLEGIKDSFKNLKSVAVNAFNAIKGAIGASGIGLLVVALGAIYAYWDDIKGAVNGVSEAQKKLNKEAEKNLKSQEDKLNAIGEQENILKLQGKSEKDILRLKVAQSDEAIKAAQINLENAENTRKAQVAAEQRNKDILQGIIRFLTAPIGILLSTVDSIGKAIGKNFGLEEAFSGGIAKLVFDPKKVAEEGDNAVKEAKSRLTKLQNDRAGALLAIKGIEKQEADAAKDKNDKIVADNKKKLEELKEQNDKWLDDYNARVEKANELELNARNAQKEAEKSLLSERNRELLEAEDEYQKSKDALMAAGYTSFETLDAAYLKKKGEINKKYNDEEASNEKEKNDKKLAKEQALIDQRLELQRITAETDAEKRAAEIAAIEEDYKRKIELARANGEETATLEAIKNAKILDINLKADEALRLSKISTLNDIAGVLGSLSSLFGQQTAANKAFTLAQIGIDTAAAISSLTKNSEANPANAVTFGAAGAVQFATGLVRILANIKKAKDLLSKSGGSTSVSAPSAPVAGASAMSPIQPQGPQAQLTQLNQASINALGNQALRAYVVETDVSSSQQRIAAIQQRARFD